MPPKKDKDKDKVKPQVPAKDLNIPASTKSKRVKTTVENSELLDHAQALEPDVQSSEASDSESNLSVDEDGPQAPASGGSGDQQLAGRILGNSLTDSVIVASTVLFSSCPVHSY